MSGSTENAASSAFENPSGRDTILTLPTANRMLVLVRRVITDLLTDKRRLDELYAEQEELDRNRRTLNWPQRRRRYQVHEEVAMVEQHVQDSLAELEVLGVVLIHPTEGQVGFPTLVNNRPAFFSWKPGEEGLHFWHFAGEKARRPIPASWLKLTETQFVKKK
ncbi:MAG: DUF2203 domain-containing protein [Gemmataceae bacterium]